MNEQPVKVEQIDRDAAAQLYRQFPILAGGKICWESIRDGYRDNGLWVQAFASHRLSTLRTAPDEVERVAQDWLDRAFGVPEDRDYSADEMVDAFIAGSALRAAPLPEMFAENAKKSSAETERVGESEKCEDDGSFADELRAALEPFAEIAKRKATLYLKPDDPIVKRAAELIDRTTSPLIVTKNGVPFEDQEEGIRQFKAACEEAATLPDRAGERREGFAPCPTCRQYSHSIGEDKLADAFKHFQSMHAHPARGHPMGYNFDETTRDAAQALMSAALRAAPLPEQAGEMREAVARIIDPFVWDEADNYRERADEWFAKGRTGPRDPLTYGYRQKAHHMQAELLAKADQILALRPSQGDREWRNGLAEAIDGEVEASSGGTIVVHVHPYPMGGWSVFNERASATLLPSPPSRQPEGE